MASGYFGLKIYILQLEQYKIVNTRLLQVIFSPGIMHVIINICLTLMTAPSSFNTRCPRASGILSMPCVIFLKKDTGLQKSRRSMSITELIDYFFISYSA